MQTIMSFNVDVGASYALRERAERLGVPMSALLNALLHDAQAMTDDQALASVQRRSAGRPRKLNKKEDAVLHAYDAMEKARKDPDHPDHQNRYFTKAEFVSAAGMYPCEALAALRGLERKGLLAVVMSVPNFMLNLPEDMQKEVEHWYRRTT